MKIFLLVCFLLAACHAINLKHDARITHEQAQMVGAYSEIALDQANLDIDGYIRRHILDVSKE